MAVAEYYDYLKYYYEYYYYDNLHQKCKSNITLNLEADERYESNKNKILETGRELQEPFQSLKHLKPILASVKWHIKQPRIWVPYTSLAD